MTALIMVFLGGGLGSVLRYVISKYFNLLPFNLPLGTLTVNILGSLLLGLFLGIALKGGQLSNNLILFLATGFCGGFTTFSTFAFENQEFLKAGDYFHFSVYTFGSLLAGFTAIFVGLDLSKLV